MWDFVWEFLPDVVLSAGPHPFPSPATFKFDLLSSQIKQVILLAFAQADSILVQFSDHGVVNLVCEYLRWSVGRVDNQVVVHFAVDYSGRTRRETEVSVASCSFASNQFVYVARDSDPKRVDEYAPRLFTDRRVDDHVVNDQINATLTHRGP